MFYTRETIGAEKLRVFDEAGQQIGQVLLLDDVNQKVWAQPLFLRDCPDPDAVLEGCPPEERLLKIQAWQGKRGPVELSYHRMEQG